MSINNNALFGTIGTNHTFRAPAWNVIPGAIRIKDEYPGEPYILDSTGGWSLPNTSEEKEAANERIKKKRRDEILKEFPIYAQLEALTEAAMNNDSTKLNALLKGIKAIKEENPKV